MVEAGEFKSTEGTRERSPEVVSRRTCNGDFTIVFMANFIAKSREMSFVPPRLRFRGQRS